MEDLYSIVVENIKNHGACTGATLELLLEKGLIDEEDVKKWEKHKTKFLAKLDQIQAATLDRENTDLGDYVTQYTEKTPVARPKGFFAFLMHVLKGL